MSEKEYFCTLTPMGEYFLGGERTFAFGENDTGDAKKDYFIESENLPSQATVFGTLRFLILQKAGLLSNGHADESRREEQARLVGEDGFSVGRADAPYGKLYHLSPIFLLRGGKRYIRVPMNHKKPGDQEEASKPHPYRPFLMRKFPGWTDLEENSLLPEDYVAKDGLFSGFLCLDGEGDAVISDDAVFEGLEHTRIAKKQDDKAFVKKVYKHFQRSKNNPDELFRIAFYCRTEENALPKNEIVYLGQDKSAFHFTCEETSEPEKGTEKALLDAVEALPAAADASVFYALSDVYMDIDEETEKLVAFSVVQKRPFRTLETQRSADSFRGSRRKSALYQLVRAGSVFYVRPGKEDDFRRLTENAAMTRIGLNFVQQLGGK